MPTALSMASTPTVGEAAMVMVMVAAASPGFNYAVFSDGKALYEGGTVDSWDSASGTYAETATCDLAPTGTNSTSGDDFNVKEGDLCGKIQVGAGGNPNSVVKHEGGTIHGTKEAMAEAIELDDVTAPSLPNGSPFEPDVTGSLTLTPDREYGVVKCTSSGEITFQPGTYVIKELVVQDSCKVNVSSGPISVYFTAKLQLQSDSFTNTTAIPSNIVFYGAGASANLVQIQGGSQAYYAVYAPNANCQLQGDSDFYGAMVCGEVQIQDTADVHFDRSLANFEGGGFTCPVEEEEEAEYSGTGGSCIPGFDHALFSDDQVTVSGTPYIDSWTSGHR